MNDQKIPVTVRVIDTSYNPDNPEAQYKGILQPTEGRVFNVGVPYDANLYVKTWDGVVLLSYMSSESLAALMAQKKNESDSEDL